MTQILVVATLLLPIVLAAVLATVAIAEEVGRAQTVSRTRAPARLVGVHHEKGHPG